MKKVLVFIKGFTPSERTKLARMTALWLGMYLFNNFIKSVQLTRIKHLKEKLIIIFPRRVSGRNLVFCQSQLL